MLSLRSCEICWSLAYINMIKMIYYVLQGSDEVDLQLACLGKVIPDLGSMLSTLSASLLLSLISDPQVFFIILPSIRNLFPFGAKASL